MSTRPIGGRAAPRQPTGAVQVRRALALAGCGVLTVTLSACESTEQESAKIGREGQQPAASQSASKAAAVKHRAPAGVARQARAHEHQAHGRSGSRG